MVLTGSLYNSNVKTNLLNKVRDRNRISNLRGDVPKKVIALETEHREEITLKELNEKWESQRV